MPFLDRPSPIICAPMAGASTPELAAAVSNAGGLGFLAAGYLSVEAMTAEVMAYQTLSDAPVAINLFTPQLDRSLELATQIETYRSALELIAAGYGISPGQPAYDEDGFTGKIAWLVANPVDEAQRAAGLGADFLVAQGSEAGGHRGTWNVFDEPNSLTAAEVTAAADAATGLPVVAAGGVSRHADVQALLAAGAVGVSIGTLFLTCDESKTPAAQKQALISGEFTESTVTLAFSGRYARALINGFVREHDEEAPSVYLNVHHLTKPIRAAPAGAGDARGMALWAGYDHSATTLGSAVRCLSF